MSTFDIVLLVVLVVFALLGWRMGLLQGVLALVGFVAGALAGARLAGFLMGAGAPEGLGDAGIRVIVVLVAAIVGQTIGAIIGAKLRDVLAWTPARWLDSLGGALLAAIGGVLAAWALATIVLALPENPASEPFRSSSLLAAVDTRVPAEAKDALAGVAGMVGQTGLPIVVGGFTDAPVGSSAPSPAEATTPGVAAVLDSVVKVFGNKPGCFTGATGSGYVSTPEHVTTNAHVVAAMDSPRVMTSEGRTYRGTVVAFDPELDVAVVHVPGLPLEPVPTRTGAQSGERGAVAGYPGGGDLTVGGAVVRAVLGAGSALGTDIYGNPGAVRSALVLNADVRPGNSGGPLFDESGNVMGLVFAKAQEDPGIGYALLAEEFRVLSRAGGAATEPVDTGPCPTG